MRISSALRLIAFVLILPFSRAADLPDVKAGTISVVSGNGMPKNIVKKGADWNFGPGSPWTHRGWQYAAYWDDARQVSVARRKLPSGEWEVASLPGYQRTESGDRGKGGSISRGFGDGHEKVAMGVSPDGVIHLAFDHHLSTLRYRTSISPVANDPGPHPWNADLFGPVADNLGGPKIESVTYPTFSTDGKSFVLYLRLNGGSGSADSHFFDYNEGKWTTGSAAVGKVIDKNWSGGDKTVNAYPHGLVFHEGRRHLTWCWRDTPEPKTSHDLCYSYSDDGGETWRNNDGKVIGITGKSFITADSPGVSVWPIPRGKRYQNGGSMTVDSAGRVHVLIKGEDGKPAHFTRDPSTAKWARHSVALAGVLVPGLGDQLYTVTEDGLWSSPASHPGESKRLATGQPDLFKDSKMGAETRSRREDGWISVIGQRGKQISVIDYPMTPLATP